ncbi:interleukin-15 isoform X2 [Hemicordylus capensis]|uniref:interleukin-15 isoform X2 n=1 Tax=Hemicordylus capensis TaxID=884348 RepID=UPI002303FC9A|nr:interleukin-15 isoform X2 [Hemicordylus capensis]
MKNYLWNSLSNEFAVTIFVLFLQLRCSYLLQVQTRSYWHAVIQDLKNIKTDSKVGALLYTPEPDSECEVSVMRCFLLEMKVILRESELVHDSTLYKSMVNVFENSKKSLPAHVEQDIATSKCRKCETFEEKTWTEFIENFKIIVQDLYKRTHKSS